MEEPPGGRGGGGKGGGAKKTARNSPSLKGENGGQYKEKKGYYTSKGQCPVMLKRERRFEKKNLPIHLEK